MPAIVACPKCKKKYQLPDTMLGKPIKCKSCGTAFQPKALPKSGSSAKSVATGQPPTTRKPAPSQPGGRPQPAAAELAQFGIDGPLRRQSTDVFAGATPASRQGPDFLGNLAAEPGFGELDVAAKPRKRRNDPSDDASSKNKAEFLKNPAVRPAATAKKDGHGKKGKNSKNQNQPFYKNILQLELVVFPILLVLSLLLSWFVPSLALTLIVAYSVTLSVAMTATAIWNLIECFHAADSTAAFIMVLFIPFYIIYFWIQHWTEVSKSATAYLVLSLAIAPLSILVYFACVYILATGADAA